LILSRKTDVIVFVLFLCFFEVSFVGRLYHGGLEPSIAGVLVAGLFFGILTSERSVAGSGSGGTGQRPVYTCVVRVVIYLNLTL
jgi:hypothetical protein